MVLLRFAKIVAAAALLAVVMAGDMMANESPRMLRSAQDSQETGTTESLQTPGGSDSEILDDDEQVKLIRAAIMRMEAKREAESPETEEDEEQGDDDVLMRMEADPEEGDDDEDVLMKMQAEPEEDDDYEDVLMKMQAVPDPTATTVMPDPTATMATPKPAIACHRGTRCYANKMKKKLQAKKKQEAQKKLQMQKNLAARKPLPNGMCPPCPCSTTKKSLAQVQAKKKKCLPGHPCPNKKNVVNPAHKNAKKGKKKAPATTAPTTAPPTTVPAPTDTPTTAPPPTDAPTAAPSASPAH